MSDRCPSEYSFRCVSILFVSQRRRGRIARASDGFARDRPLRRWSWFSSRRKRCRGASRKCRCRLRLGRCPRRRPKRHCGCVVVSDVGDRRGTRSRNAGLSLPRRQTDSQSGESVVLWLSSSSRRLPRNRTVRLPRFCANAEGTEPPCSRPERDCVGARLSGRRAPYGSTSSEMLEERTIGQQQTIIWCSEVQHRRQFSDV
jgi:hypothetical protein